MTLSDLPALYAAARSEASASKPVIEDLPPNICRYCGKHLRLLPGTSNDGHAKCVVGLVFQRAVYELWWSSPAMALDQIAEACGVSVATVRAWIANVEKVGRAA